MTFPLSTLAPTIDAAGISAPSYSDIYQSLIASFQAIYGADIYVAADSQDGQLLAIFAKAIHESNQATVAMFQSFSPTFAQGANLSSRVKINGLLRHTASKSTAVGVLTGVVGTVVISGVVKDTAGNLWDLPASVTIPIAGTITVTATAQQEGSIIAAIGDIDEIYNPQLGWQTFTNTAAATPGSPVETDAELRQRQSISTSLPASTTITSILASIGNVEGVARFAVYENDTGSTDSNGLPAHSFAAVISGGDSMSIAEAIALKKPPGIQTYGTTSVAVTDPIGIPSLINYFVLATVPVYIAVAITALPGYVATTGVAIKEALADYLNTLAIGEYVYLSQARGVASLMGNPTIGKTFRITGFAQDITPAPVATADLAIAFNAAASGNTANFSVTVT